MVTIRTSTATGDRWDDVVAVFGSRGNDPSWCWCRRFLDSPSDAEIVPDNRAALRDELASAAVPPGIVAYVDEVPAGWTRVMPRDAVPGVARNRALTRILDDDPSVWWVTCFSVDRRYRSLGVAAALLQAAVAHAQQHGASALEGHPVDTEALEADSVSGSALFTGTMRTFVAAGFHEIGRTYPSRPVMRRDL
jgi:GNAT superfamily N-acetyltransferase